MKKNVGSQVIGAQMVSASDGSAFTGSVTVYVTGDGGTQAIGSVASGACTHEGNGFHTYVPAQAETNYDHVAYTFIGTGAIPATVQAYPTFPQTGDNYARLGAPSGASVSADVAAVKAVLPSALGANGNIKADVRDYNGTAGTFAGGRPEVNTTHAAGTAWNSGAIGASTLAADTITAAKIATDAVTEIQTGLATASSLAAVAEVTGRIATMIEAAPGSPNEFRFTADALARMQTVIGMAAGNLDAQLAAQLTAIGTRLASASYTAPDNATLALVAEITERLRTMLEPATGSPGEFRYTADALVRAPTGSGGGGGGLSQADVRDAVGLASANLDTQLAAIKGDTTAAALVAAQITTMLESAPGSPGDYRLSADALQRVIAVLGMAAGDLDAQIAAVRADVSGVADPWATALPGAYGAGTAGKIVGDNLNATVSSRATQTSVDDLPTNAELATALAAADDAVLAQVALVKAKTDNLPLSPAAVSDIPTATENADALLTRDMSAVDDSAGPAVRMPIDALRHIRNRFSTVAVPGFDVVYKEDDITEAWRQALTTDPAAEPITGTNPT